MISDLSAIHELSCVLTLQVDGVSSIGALPFEMDKWGVDVAVTGSQKALSLPTGLAVMAVSEKVHFCKLTQESFVDAFVTAIYGSQLVSVLAMLATSACWAVHAG